MITNEVVNQAISYIMEHIEEEILIEDVADYCHFSKYYFSRVFKETTGESVYAFIKRVRMEQSAFRLKVERDKSVTDIGLDYGYSPSNYSSVFRQHHNASPVGFRKTIYKKSLENPTYEGTEVRLETFEECSEKITIEQVEDQFVIYERKIGNYRDLEQDWARFINKYQKYMTGDSLMMERTFDDPSITDSSKCLYDICISVPRDCPLPNTCVIEGGKFAVYHYKGMPDLIYSAYQSIFNVWLPQKKMHIDKRYGFEIYREVNCDDMYLKMELYIPIQ